jgi:hypothetical protein
MDYSNLVAVDRLDQAIEMPIVTSGDDYTPERIEREAELILRDAPEHIAAAFRAAGVGVEFLAELLRVSVEAVHAQGLAVEGSRTIYYAEPAVSHHLLVDAPTKEWTAACWAIADALVEQFENPIPELIGFSCEPLDSPTRVGRFDEVLE